MLATDVSATKLQALAGLLDAQDTVLICIDTAEVVTLAEGRRLATMGLRHAAPLGRPLAELFDESGEELARWRRCLGGERLRTESVHAESHWLQIYSPLRAADGATIGAALVAFELDLATIRQAHLLRELVNNVPTNVFAIDPAGICELSQGGLLAQLGLSPDQNVGVNVFDVYAGIPNLAESLRAAFRGETRVIEFGFGSSLYSQAILPRRDALGACAGAFCIVSDITERRRDEDLMRSQLSVITGQKEAILQLSSPIIEVGHDVLAVPLVGAIDGDRAMTLTHGLLEAITRKRARFAILDLTGVNTIDPESAEHLVRIIRSIRLLGAQAVITGIRPAIAETMVNLGLDLTGFHTLRSLQDGLRYCDDTGAQAR